MKASEVQAGAPPDGTCTLALVADGVCTKIINQSLIPHAWPVGPELSYHYEWTSPA